MKKVISMLVVCLTLLMVFSVCAAQEAEEQELSPQVTVLSERRSDEGILDRGKIEPRPLSLREELLVKLRYAHMRGEHLDITEEMIREIPLGELVPGNSRLLRIRKLFCNGESGIL